MNKMQFSKKAMGILNIIFGLVGIISFIYAIYTFKLSYAVREPIILVDFFRTNILSSDRIQDAPIKVFTKDGKEIKSDLTAVKLFLGNSGKKPIKSEHILEDIVISINDPNAEIIEYKVVRETRKIVKCQLEPINDSKNSLKLNFSVLEYKDAAEIQLLYIGNPDAEIKLVSGIIEESEPIILSSTRKYIETSISYPVPHPIDSSPEKLFSFDLNSKQ